MTPSITFTMTDRTIRRYQRDGSHWRKGQVSFELRTFKIRYISSQGLNLVGGEISIYRTLNHYSLEGDPAYAIIKGRLGDNLDWDAALQLIKERIIAQLVCKHLQETA